MNVTNGGEERVVVEVQGAEEDFPAEPEASLLLLVCWVATGRLGNSRSVEQRSEKQSPHGGNKGQGVWNLCGKGEEVEGGEAGDG